MTPASLRLGVDLGGTKIEIAALAADEKARVAARLQALVDTHPALAGQAEIRFPYRTEAYRVLRLD